MRIPLGGLLFSMPNFCFVLGAHGAASRWRARVNELLRIIAGFGRRVQKRFTNSRQEAVYASEIR